MASDRAYRRSVADEVARLAAVADAIADPSAEMIERIVQAMRRHFLMAQGKYDRCVCDGWVEGDDWDEHMAGVVLAALAEAVTPDGK
jgi:hypothetical protein